jgi:uncharacterized protein YpmB
MLNGLSETTAILIVIILAVIFVALWMFNNKQKRKFEDAQHARKRELAELKAKAAQKNQAD